MRMNGSRGVPALMAAVRDSMAAVGVAALEPR